MGNCQAVDNASLILQTQNGRSERFYSQISAAEIMKLHPGHHVALLLTTTFYSTSPPSTSSRDGLTKPGPGSQEPSPCHPHQTRNNNNNNNNNNSINTNQPLRVTRIKLLRPTDNLLLGHAYRLLTNQEVMKGLKAKKNGKSNSYKQNLINFQSPDTAGKIEAKSNCEASTATSNNQLGKIHQQTRKGDKHRLVTAAAPMSSKSSKSKPKGWHPSLNSISEATT